MPETIVCCKDLPDQAPCPSPFSKIIALGFYDGPTSGLLDCQICAANYSFEMLDWDDNHEVRIFRLAPLPLESLKRVTQILGSVERPSWPVWVPFARTIPPQKERDALDRRLEDVLNKAGSPSLLVALSQAGYGKQILAAMHVPPRELTTARDWFSTDEGEWFSRLGLAPVTD